MFDLKYKVGDRVCYKHQNPNDNVEVGEVGTICGISELTGNYGVAFETKDVYKHSCDGLCEDYCGWWCDENTLEPVDADGGKIPTPSKPVSIEEQLGLPKGVSIHDLDITSSYRPMSIEIQPLELVCSEEEKEIAEKLAKELNDMLGVSFTKKEEKKMPTKFTFYVTEGTRPDKSPDGDGKGVIPTMTTEVIYKDNDGCANGGSATCDKADYNERQGCLEAIANAVLGGNFDREYEKFLADKKHKYDESCKCKICGCKYYEDEKTGKRTPFTPEDARKHEEWHEQNKKNKREKYLIRKEAKRRLAEAEREGKIEQTMKELYKK